MGTSPSQRGSTWLPPRAGLSAGRVVQTQVRELRFPFWSNATCASDFESIAGVTRKTELNCASQVRFGVTTK